MLQNYTLLIIISISIIVNEKRSNRAFFIIDIFLLGFGAVYRVLVLMVQMGISIDDIKRELASRHVIDHKVKQEKMTK